MTVYLLLKYAHVLAAITAVGLNLSYGVWLTLVGRAASERPFVLRTVKLLDDRVANPAYVVLLLSGLAMVAVGALPITTTWVTAALVLYAVLVILGIGVFSPALGRQIAISAAQPTDEVAYAAAARRTTLSGAALVLTAVAIVFLMVAKPSL